MDDLAADHYEIYFTYPPESDLSLHFTGRESCSPLHTWKGIRNHYLLHYVVKGYGRAMTTDGFRRLGPGDGFLYFPGQRCWYQAEEEQPWTYTWVGFAGQQADKAVRQAGFAEDRTVWHAAPDPILKRQFRDLGDPAHHGSSGSPLRATGLLYLLLDRIETLMGPLSPTRDSHPSGAIARVFRFVELHYGQEIGVADMARHAGLERTYFSSFFKRQTGQSPSRYLLEYRMANAERLLREGKLSIKEIAFSVGYENYFAFAKVFKKSHSRTPGEFRAMHVRL